MDVCSPRAIDMRVDKTTGVEGSFDTLVRLQAFDSTEEAKQKMMTFPFLAIPQLCDGCLDCVKECPVSALELKGTAEPAVIENSAGHSQYIESTAGHA